MKLRTSTPLNFSLIAGAVLTTATFIVAVFHATSDVMVMINIAAILIVFGGLVASCVVMFPMQKIVDLFRKIFYYLRYKQESQSEIAAEIIRAAFIYSRTKSTAELKEVKNKRVYDALEILQSGLRRDDVAQILTIKKETTGQDAFSEASLLFSLAKLAPGYGLVGTLIGLIVLLLDMGSGNFEKVGPAMAISLTATLYGVLIANLLFMPLAEFITHRAEATARVDELIERAVLGLLDNKHPLHLKEFVKAHLSEVEQRRFDVMLEELVEADRNASRPAQEANVA